MTPVDRLPARPDWLDVLIARATRADGQPPFSDGSLVELATGAREIHAIGDVAAALVAPGEAEFVVDPDARRHGRGGELLDALLAESPGLRVWAHGDHVAARRLAASRGMVAARELLQLRREVSTSSTRFEGSKSSTRLGGFDLARDGDDWVALNARAFAAHPEQGRVTRADLDVLAAESWFRADDLLVLRDGDRMVGYSWMKVEHGVGEFYVVGVDPDRQGEGLGRRLVAAGLAHLAGRGIRTAALYVEGDNLPALALYRSFGFADHAVDIQYAAPGA